MNWYDLNKLNAEEEQEENKKESEEDSREEDTSVTHNNSAGGGLSLPSPGSFYRAPKPKNKRAPITEKQRAPSLFIGAEEASCERAPITEVVGANLELTTIKHGLGSKIDSYYSITGVKLSESQDKVYRGYHELGAVTDCEMEEAVGVDKNIVNARRNELMSKGLVEFAYKKYNEKTRKYNNAYRLKGN